jgi:hypothetical protein
LAKQSGYILTGKVGTGDNLLYSQAGTPALDLRFASTKSLTDFVTQQNLVTFTRASSATYIDSTRTLQTAATNVPRFDHNPTTGESLGLLVEEARTNSFIYSNTFTDASWEQIFGTTITRTANAAVSPDGTSNATQITATDANFFRQQAVGDTTTIRTLSFFAKAGTASTISVRFFSGTAPNSPTATFNFSTGAATVTDALVMTASIVQFPNGWYRCVCCRTDGVLKSPPDFNFGVGTTFIYGAQLEAGAFPTSYIPTTTATVTRSADVASITGTNFSSWYNQSQGSFASQQRILGLTGAGANFSGNASGADGYIDAPCRLNSFGNFTSIMNGPPGNSTQAQLTQSGIDFTSRSKTANAYQINNYAFCVNGNSVLTDTSCNLPTVDTLTIGSQSNNYFLNGTIARLTYFPVRLPDATLQTLTS